MKYILMMNTMKAGSPGFPGWTKEDIQAHIAHMIRLNKDLRESGEFVLADDCEDGFAADIGGDAEEFAEGAVGELDVFIFVEQQEAAGLGEGVDGIES